MEGIGNKNASVPNKSVDKYFKRVHRHISRLIANFENKYALEINTPYERRYEDQLKKLKTLYLQISDDVSY